MRTIVDILDYIESHLDEEISVGLICSLSGYSPFHFQRLFSRCAGTTLGTYITRRRLTRAALALNATKQRIIEIGQAAGYESQEAFTRAFKDVFALTPAAYRKQGQKPVLKAFPAFDIEMVRHVKTQAALTTPRFVEREAFTVIGARAHVLRNQTESIGTQLWPDFLRRLKDIPDKRGSVGNRMITYGLLLNDGSTDGPEYEAFDYMAGVEVAPHTTPPEGLSRVDIAAQRYAVFTHTGFLASLSLTNKYIWGVWVPQNKVKIAAAPDMEVYVPAPTAATESQTEIWIPLAP